MDIMEYAFENSEKKPLDHIALDGGMCGIFRTIGCIGDSLSSGEFQVPAPADSQIPWRWIDCFEYSWGQYIARHTRSKVYNFSHGGITARHYWEHFAEEQGFWETDKLCQAYILALGANDLNGKNGDLGSISDIHIEDYNLNADTFAGYFGRIIQRLKTMQPKSRFF